MLAQTLRHAAHFCRGDDCSAAMGAKCKGHFGSGRPCKASRSKPGQQVCIKGPCSVCNEPRCKSHCRCGRDGTAVGRAAARPGHGAQKFGVPAVVSRSAPPTASGSRLPSLDVEVLEGDVWFARLAEDIRQAASVVIGSYTYDEPEIQTALERRLRSRACDVEVFVDHEEFDKGTTRHERSRLLALQKQGAVVRKCKGKPRSHVYGPYARGSGHFHKKVVIIDKRILYHGNANCTRNSRCNDESVLRLTGHPVVMTVLNNLAEARAKSDLLLS